MRWMAGVIGVLAAWAMGPPAMAAAGPAVLQVDLATGLAPASGRLLVFVEPLAAAQGKNGGLAPVEAFPFGGAASVVAAQEIARIEPGAAIDVDLDTLAYPTAVSSLPPGDYALQAVLDVHHDYNYLGRGHGDIVSPVVRIHLPLAGSQTILLEKAEAAVDPWSPPGARPAELARLAALRPHAQPIAFVSPSLSAFWGRPITMRGWVVTPPGYQAKGGATYPTVFYTHGFGGSADRLVRPASTFYAAMAAKETPPMIWVLLDQSTATGTQEFADSVNNGPWGHALTAELIPDLERRYRMDARSTGRFLSGHSSGGWATLWLQTRYPKLFGGAWSTSPDPSDFHDFTGVDIYAPGANAYRAPDGHAWPLVRENGKVTASIEQFSRLEVVIGAYGGQESSFDWVFSPRGPDGRPQPMFDRITGAVDPGVARYWRDHFDIAYRLQKDWPALKPDLNGKIHVAVGTADTFYLDGAAHRLQAVLDGLGARSRFQFIPGRTHFDLYKIGDDDQGLLKAFTWEMYAIARPGSNPRPNLPSAKPAAD
jgi:S-formylglutathione hydrolase FrmB